MVFHLSLNKTLAFLVVVGAAMGNQLVSAEDMINYEAKINLEGANLDETRFDHDGSAGNFDLQVQEPVFDGVFFNEIVPFGDNGPVNLDLPELDLKDNSPLSVSRGQRHRNLKKKKKKKKNMKNMKKKNKKKKNMKKSAIPTSCPSSDPIPSAIDFQLVVDDCLDNGDCPFGSDIRCWDTHLVTNMTAAFQDRKKFNEPIGGWNVGAVKDMSYMFAGASSFNQPLEGWDVSSVRDMESMFGDASSFNQPLEAWNVSSVQDMVYMFAFATSFNQLIEAWDVSSVTGMSLMFYFASSFNQPLQKWDVTSVTDLISMFEFAESFDQCIDSWVDKLPVNADTSYMLAETGCSIPSTNFETGCACPL